MARMTRAAKVIPAVDEVERGGGGVARGERVEEQAV